MSNKSYLGREQHLIDIMFEVAMSVQNNPWFLGKSQEEVAEWLRGQLKECGFETEPRGASWAVLINQSKQ